MSNSTCSKEIPCDEYVTQPTLDNNAIYYRGSFLPKGQLNLTHPDDNKGETFVDLFINIADPNDLNATEGVLMRMYIFDAGKLSS